MHIFICYRRNCKVVRLIAHKGYMKSHNSHSYQHLYYEVYTSDDVLSFFSNDKSFSPNENQALLELKDQLFARVLSLAPDVLTEKQYTVFKMYYLENISTPGIARILGVDVSCVRSQLKGGGTNKGNNGAVPRLKNYLFKDEICLNLLKQIQDCS